MSVYINESSETKGRGGPAAEDHAIEIVLNIQGSSRVQGGDKDGSYLPSLCACIRSTGIFYAAKGAEMETETRIALIGIIVENQEITDELNRILHEFGEYIVGRMGIPYKKQKVCIISVIVDAPNNVISSLSGKLGMLDGISVKTVYSKK